jgi:catechol 2,3-dioxygenase-like lactoylglutathione lyase family enzyme
MPSITGGHHIALTVSDADRSAEWYAALLGMSVVLADEDETVKFRVLADRDSGWVLGVRQYLQHDAGTAFDEFRVGLDHFAFGVESRAALEEWEHELGRRSIPFTPIAETPIGSVIVFRDPDNIQLEFWLPAG